MTRWPHGDPNVLVRAILAQPAYRQRLLPVDPSKSWFELLSDFIGKALHRLFGGLHVPAHGVWTATQALGVTMLLAAAVGIVIVIYRICVNWTRSGRSSVRAEHAPLGAYAPASDVRAAALAAAGAEAYARAIGLTFRAALLALDADGSIAFNPARTPGEYRRLVRLHARTAAAPFDELTSRFIRASFAAETPSRAEFEAAWRALRDLDTALVARQEKAA